MIAVEGIKLMARMFHVKESLYILVSAVRPFKSDIGMRTETI